MLGKASNLPTSMANAVACFQRTCYVAHVLVCCSHMLVDNAKEIHLLPLIKWTWFRILKQALSTKICAQVPQTHKDMTIAPRHWSWPACIEILEAMCWKSLQVQHCQNSGASSTKYPEIPLCKANTPELEVSSLFSRFPTFWRSTFVKICLETSHGLFVMYEVPSPLMQTRYVKWHRAIKCWIWWDYKRTNNTWNITETCQMLKNIVQIVAHSLLLVDCARNNRELVTRRWLRLKRKYGDDREEEDHETNYKMQQNAHKVRTQVRDWGKSSNKHIYIYTHIYMCACDDDKYHSVLHNQGRGKTKELWPQMNFSLESHRCSENTMIGLAMFWRKETCMVHLTWTRDWRVALLCFPVSSAFEGNRLYSVWCACSETLGPIPEANQSESSMAYILNQSWVSWDGCSNLGNGAHRSISSHIIWL